VKKKRKTCLYTSEGKIDLLIWGNKRGKKKTSSSIFYSAGKGRGSFPQPPYIGGREEGKCLLHV